MKKTSLESKTKAELLDLIFQHEETVENLQDVISKLTETKEDNNELIKAQLHRNKAYDSINISKERVGIALDILAPVANEVTSKLEKITDNEEVIELANNVLINELTKIAKQQQAELNYKFEVK